MKKKLIISLLATLVLMTTVIGAWVLFGNTSYTAQVVNTPNNPAVFTVDFSNYEINTSLSATDTSINATITNINGDLDLTAIYSVNKFDVADDCSDYINDCDHTLYYDGGVINSGDSFTLSNGDHTFTSRLQCVRLSCPQQITVSLNFTET